MREEISNDRIILKALDTEFSPKIFEAAKESQGGEFTRWMPWCHEDYKIEETEEFVKKCIEEREAKEDFTFAVFDIETDEFCGFVGLNARNKLHEFYNVGYWIRISKQNQSIVSTAVRLLAKAAFEDLPINRLEILAAFENIPSQKAAEKAGATREGILRKRLVIGGRLHDAVVFSFVREDFE